MLEQSFTKVYLKFKLNFYKRIFSRFETREASLTAVETFCVEVIHALNKPTVNEFSRFVNISQANAAYKIQSLIDKGYVQKEQSKMDKREYNLLVTEKFHHYNSMNLDYIHEVMERMSEHFTPEEITKFGHMFEIMDEKLMPEIVLFD